MNLKIRTIETLKAILESTQLSAHAGKYEAMEKANWFQRIGRQKLKTLIRDLEASQKPPK